MKKQISLLLLLATLSVQTCIPNAKRIIQRHQKRWFRGTINVSHSNLAFQNLTFKSFSFSSFHGTWLCYSWLQYTNFQYASLNGSDLSHTIATNTDFRNANLTGAKANGIKLYNNKNNKEDAKVENSNWKDVTGLTNEQKIWLVAHGAKNVPPITKKVAREKTEHAKAVAKAGILTRMYKYITRARSEEQETE